MNYSQGFYNMNDYMNPNSMPPYYGNIPMPVMGMACMDNMGYPSSMPFIPDSYIPTKSNMPMPDGDMPALPNMPMNNMPGMPNMNMPTYPEMPGMPSTMPGMPSTMPGMPSTMPGMPSTMPGMPITMPGMPNSYRPPYPMMPNMPEENIPSSPIMPGTQMNCKQLYEYMKRMNCMEQLNNMNDMQIDED